MRDTLKDVIIDEMFQEKQNEKEVEFKRQIIARVTAIQETSAHLNKLKKELLDLQLEEVERLTLEDLENL